MDMPRTDAELAKTVQGLTGLRIPRRAISADSAAPLAYLSHAFFERPGQRDCVVWANRGGGKTQLGAIATLLDLVFKPGIEVRILGGSLEQSSRMYRYLRELLDQPRVRSFVEGRITQRGVRLTNGSRVELLSQSERAVRGTRVQKLRCDEIELFDEDVWRAAQLVTMSRWCGSMFVHGAVEAFSTMHQPFGLMRQVVDRISAEGGSVFRWGLIDTLEGCPPARPCVPCPLLPECGGRAKHGSGFMQIDDAIAQKQRVDDQTWATEMLCAAPSVRDMVYASFAVEDHVRPLDRSGLDDEQTMIIGGVDFGYRAPTVVLWAVYDRDADRLHVFDELVVREMVTERIIDAVQARQPRADWFGADPAGHQRNEHTGQSTIALWTRRGLRVRTRMMRVEAGIATVRRRVRSASGDVGLWIDPRCSHLIRAVQQYHYHLEDDRTVVPVKDGPDHAADALRYMIVNLDRGEGVKRRGY